MLLSAWVKRFRQKNPGFKAPIPEPRSENPKRPGSLACKRLPEPLDREPEILCISLDLKWLQIWGWFAQFTRNNYGYTILHYP